MRVSWPLVSANNPSVSLIGPRSEKSIHLDQLSSAASLSPLFCSDSDRWGLERRDVPRHRVPGRRPPRHVLLHLLHRSHSLWKLYPLGKSVCVYKWPVRGIKALFSSLNFDDICLRVCLWRSSRSCSHRKWLIRSRVPAHASIFFSFSCWWMLQVAEAA